MFKDQYLRAIIAALIKFRRPIGFLIFSISIFSFYHLSKIEIDNSLSIWFVKDDVTYESYAAFQRDSGSDEIIIASIPIESEQLAVEKNSIQVLQNTLSTNPVVLKTYSLFDANYPLLVGNKLVSARLYDSKRSAASQLKLLNQFSDLSNQLISENRENLFLYVQLLPSNEIEAIKSKEIEAVISTIQEHSPSAIISGPPVLNEAYNEGLFLEAVIFGTLSFIVILFVLFRLLPSRKYMGIAIGSILLPPLYLLGLVGFFDIKLNMISALIPTLLLVYALSDTVHIINALHRSRISYPNKSQLDWIVLSIKHSFIPCMLTTLTTIIGYLALVFSGLPALHSMGFLAAIGILIAFFMGYLVLILGLSFTIQDNPVFDRSRHNNSNFSFEKMINQILVFSHLSKAKIIFILAITLSVVLWSSWFVSVDTESIDLLADGSAKNDIIALEEQLGGSFRMQLDLQFLNNREMFSEDNLEKLSALDQRLRNDDQIKSVFSIYSLKKFFENRYPQGVFRKDQLEYEKSLMSFVENSGNSIFNLFNLAKNTLSFTITFPQSSSAEIGQLIQRIEKDYEEVFGGSATYLKINGFATVFARLNEYVVQSQLRSFIIAFLLIGVFFMLYLRSIKRVIIVLIPNLIPVFAVSTLMVWLDISLGVTTAMIAPIVLGISMDDTLHILYNFRSNQKLNKDIAQALEYSIKITSPSLIISSVSLAIGFLIISFSRIPAVADFGLLCMVAVLSALFADLLIVPALVRRFWL
ncbi:MAG: MMPL family transporter [Flavobacteriaceae bacterium]